MRTQILGTEFVLFFSALENTIVIPAPYKTLAVRSRNQVHCRETFNRVRYISKGGGALCRFSRHQSTQGEPFPLWRTRRWVILFLIKRVDHAQTSPYRQSVWVLQSPQKGLLYPHRFSPHGEGAGKASTGILLRISVLHARLSMTFHSCNVPQDHPIHIRFDGATAILASEVRQWPTNENLI
jgi:hypothetical protein